MADFPEIFCKIEHDITEFYKKNAYDFDNYRRIQDRISRLNYESMHRKYILKFQ